MPTPPKALEKRKPAPGQKGGEGKKKRRPSERNAGLFFSSSFLFFRRIVRALLLLIPPSFSPFLPVQPAASSFFSSPSSEGQQQPAPPSFFPPSPDQRRKRARARPRSTLYASFRRPPSRRRPRPVLSAGYDHLLPRPLRIPGGQTIKGLRGGAGGRHTRGAHARSPGPATTKKKHAKHAPSNFSSFFLSCFRIRGPASLAPARPPPPTRPFEPLTY